MYKRGQVESIFKEGTSSPFNFQIEGRGYFVLLNPTGALCSGEKVQSLNSEIIWVAVEWFWQRILWRDQRPLAALLLLLDHVLCCDWWLQVVFYWNINRNAISCACKVQSIQGRFTCSLRFLANCFISGFLFLLKLRVQGECTTQLRFMVAHWTCISELMGPTFITSWRILVSIR